MISHLLFLFPHQLPVVFNPINIRIRNLIVKFNKTIILFALVGCEIGYSKRIYNARSCNNCFLFHVSWRSEDVFCNASQKRLFLRLIFCLLIKGTLLKCQGI